jgi:hypothetical protein
VWRSGGGGGGGAFFKIEHAVKLRIAITIKVLFMFAPISVRWKLPEVECRSRPWIGICS